ncbi:MYND-type domain-containing protein [Favolaschia claudopus]|uniref:MYND-type domain-containing protein n=1 Tax=Favolaschia claudopus TaxID=2862362 RepID=A0AAW0BMD4_9AGAR
MKTEYVAGFENPMTTWTIHPDSDSDSESERPPESSKPNSWRNVQFLNAAGNGYGPHATTFGDIADKIPARPSLKKSCEKCGKRPDQNGSGYAGCASCKVARYCSRDCQTSHWKEHKKLCQARVKQVKREQESEAEALRTKKPFIPQATLRKWYYDNIDIVSYAIVQILELYRGRTRADLWRTHAAVIFLGGGEKGTHISANDIGFDDGEADPLTKLMRADQMALSSEHLEALGLGRRIIVVLVLNDWVDMALVETYDLPEEEEWAKMEKDEMWRMHIRMRDMARTMTGDSESADTSESG